MNQLSTPELDNAHSGTGAVSLTSEGTYSAGFRTRMIGKGCVAISDEISRPRVSMPSDPGLGIRQAAPGIPGAVGMAWREWLAE